MNNEKEVMLLLTVKQLKSLNQLFRQSAVNVDGLDEAIILRDRFDSALIDAQQLKKSKSEAK